MVNELTFKRSNGYIYAKYSAFDGIAEVSTGHKCTKEQWEFKKLPKATSNLMVMLETQVTRFAESKDRAGQKVLKAEIETILRDALGKKQKVGTSTLGEDLLTFKQKIQEGKILNEKRGNKPYAAGKADAVDTLLFKLTEIKMAGVKTAAFTHEHYNRVISEMIRLKHTQNTINNYCATLMTFFKITAEKGWHANTWWLGKKTAVGTDDIEGNQYLNEAEIKTLLAVETHNELERRVADIFCFGCCVGLRISDLSMLHKSVFVEGILHKMNQKTGAVVQIPLKAFAREIWAKYDYKFPPVNKRTFHDNLADLAERAGFTSECHFVSTIGGVRTEQTFKKYELITPHTMRRSFATNAYLAGMHLYDIMKFTGHVKLESLLKYICVTTGETAQRLKGHAFFQ